MNNPLNIFRIAATVAATIAALPAAHAQAFDAVRLYNAAPGSSGGAIGLAVLAGTEYMGSDERRTRLLPILDYQWANGWFAGVTNGVGYNFSRSPSLQFGLRVTANLGREEKRSPVLRGLGDIDSAAEVGGFFNIDVVAGFSISTSLRYGAGNDNKGLVADLGADYSTAFAPQWRFSAGVGLTAANADYMQSYFGITPAQSVSSGYRGYAPKAGLRDLRSSVALTYQFNRGISLTTALTASTLLGDAVDSPLTRRKTAVHGIMAVSYAF